MTQIRRFAFLVSILGGMALFSACKSQPPRQPITEAMESEAESAVKTVVELVPPPLSQTKSPESMEPGFYDVTDDPESPFQRAAAQDYRETSGRIIDEEAEASPLLMMDTLAPVINSLTPATPPPPAELSPASPLADLMSAYTSEFKDNLWLMGRLKTGRADMSNGSFEIDRELNVVPKFDSQAAQIEIIRVVKEEKRLDVYYSFRYFGISGVRSRNATVQYFWFDLTSASLYNMLRQKRDGALGFEIATQEISPGKIPPPR
ncbi:MAG: hypothetical protein LBS64_06665 [Spirochaetaceae bacterium]|jgi:hypothetical protein|nr:hypothetical protein [Spirochaetaceae bacterium]